MSEALESASTPAAPKRRWGRRLAWLAAAIVVLLMAGELVARFYYGLGDPPLSMADPDMEYRFQPDKTYHRFGHEIHYNAYSQRADDFPPHKTQPNETRVMVIGDSIINGGALTDQSQTITALLQRRLTDELHRPVI